jgi:hypothetical protein
MVDQSSRVGNDYWQTDYDFSKKTYTMTFNPMLGDVSGDTLKLREFPQVMNGFKTHELSVA